MNTEVPRKDFFESQKIKRGFYTGVTLSLLLCGVTLWFNLREVSAQRNNIAKVVIAVPVHGEQGQSVIDGVRLAFDDFSVVNGRKVVPEIVDTGNISGVSVAAQEVQAAQDATRDGRVIAYIGPLDEMNVQAVTPILNTSYIVNIPTASATDVYHTDQSNSAMTTKIFPTGFRSSIRVVPNETVEEYALQNIVETLKLQGLVAVSNNELHQETGLGITQVTPQSFLVSSLKKGTGVYIGLSPNDPTLPNILKQLATTSIPIIFNHEFNRTSQIFITGQQLTNPIYVIGLGGNEAVARRNAPEFTARFNKKYNTDPDKYALAGYDAASAIIEIMRNTSSVSRGAYMTALARLKSFNGSYQRNFLDTQGEIKNNMVTLYQLNDESLDYVTSYIYEHQ
ncbi:MAG TPA: hypothetical protein VGE63_02820 [Candidatus Paceibacterota bacterium]